MGVSGAGVASIAGIIKFVPVVAAAVPNIILAAIPSFIAAPVVFFGIPAGLVIW